MFSFVSLFRRFIRDSRRGIRLLPNGEKLAAGTVVNYEYTLKILIKFCVAKGFYLRIRSARNITGHEIIKERNYWKDFYKRFMDFMYNDLGYFDNYAGQTIKNIRAFYNYLNKELAMGVGDFYKLFYVRKEQIDVFALSPEQLNFLIYDKVFENSLSQRMKQVKDFFVFGCTVALRFSDLVSLRTNNLRLVNGQLYLAACSKKTKTDSLVKLPPYAIEVINRYTKFNKKKLLPTFNISNLNKFVKRLLEAAGYTQSITATRHRRGKAIELKNTKAGAKYNRFCDVATTHTMRKTAITTMLCLGVPEQVVRKISGHAAGSKEFYRYVSFAQTYQDHETETMFQKLSEKKMSMSH
jgi:integrase